MKTSDLNDQAQLKSIKLKCLCAKKSGLKWESDRLICITPSCHHNKYINGFKSEGGVPYVISDYLCDTVCTGVPNTQYIKRSTKYLQNIKKQFVIENRISIRNSQKFVDSLLLKTKNPQILIIGSAEIGTGTNIFLNNPNVVAIGLDIYKTKTVDIIADAHYLPFNESTFDGVWVQAVLEHVIDPNLVANEIYRVLKLSGTIYSEIPFMQPVHEGAYDLTRYTLTGHRYLFKKFEKIDCGVLDGPSEAFTWALKYWLMATIKNRLIANIISQSTYWLILKPLSLLTGEAKSIDFFSGSYFLGTKSLLELRHSQVIETYSRR